jgi:hypothetical protein
MAAVQQLLQNMIFLLATHQQVLMFIDCQTLKALYRGQDNHVVIQPCSNVRSTTSQLLI